MEITKELKQDLSELESACSSFLGKYESQLTDALNKTKMSAEDSLKIDLMLELVISPPRSSSLPTCRRIS